MPKKLCWGRLDPDNRYWSITNAWFGAASSVHRSSSVICGMNSLACQTNSRFGAVHRMDDLPSSLPPDGLLPDRRVPPETDRGVWPLPGTVATLGRTDGIFASVRIVSFFSETNPRSRKRSVLVVSSSARDPTRVATSLTEPWQGADHYGKAGVRRAEEHDVDLRQPDAFGIVAKLSDVDGIGVGEDEREVIDELVRLRGELLGGAVTTDRGENPGEGEGDDPYRNVYMAKYRNCTHDYHCS